MMTFWIDNGKTTGLIENLQQHEAEQEELLPGEIGYHYEEITL